MATLAKYQKELNKARFIVEGIEESIDSVDKDDIALAYERIVRLIQGLEQAKDEVIQSMLEEDKTMSEIKEWNIKQKEEIIFFRDKRKRFKGKLEEINDREEMRKRESDFEHQKSVMEEQFRIHREEEREREAIKIRLQEREEEMYQRKLAMEREVEKERKEEEKSKPQAVKLQKYTITPFNGDYKDWLRFWNQFSIEVDGSTIAEISKFNYLLELVRGKPRDDILGLPHTVEGYCEAKRILEANYGKDIKVHKSFIKELEGLPAIHQGFKLQDVHEFHDKLARITRTLKTMRKIQGAQSYVYSLMDKLGPVRELIIQRDDKWEEWGLEELTENLHKYVDRNPLPAESFERVKPKETIPQWNRDGDKLLLANESRQQRRVRGCVYCGLSNHKGINCNKVLDIATRRDILRKNKLCFNCTGFGHPAAKCRSKGCLKCGSRHHTSLFDAIISPIQPTEKPPENTVEKALGAVNREAALHPIVVAKVNGINARILLDTGAGSSYICTKLITDLKLKPKRAETRTIEQLYGTVTKQVEIYNVTITSNAVEDFKMSLDCINGEKEILTHFPNQRIREIKKNNQPLRRLVFSDEETSDDKLPVHLILGVVDYQRIKSNEPGILGYNPDKDPGAELTMLGWVLLGRAVSSTPEPEKNFFLNSSKREFEQMCSLDVIDSAGNTKQDESLHQDFTDHTERLAWEEDHYPLPTNRELSLARLKSTTERYRTLRTTKHGTTRKKMKTRRKRKRKKMDKKRISKTKHSGGLPEF
eukprot:Seg3525.2 transcript_id=Seg3525.2/GoldUCD/mRNA.D3Y31 product="hypothetical protein" protein_id=Seg3525.2/GoldUCD/D3Y31